MSRALSHIDEQRLACWREILGELEQETGLRIPSLWWERLILGDRDPRGEEHNERR